MNAIITLFRIISAYYQNSGVSHLTHKKDKFVLNLVSKFNKFSWCSGYHIRLTRGRSPVRSRAKTCVPRGLTARISGFHPGGLGSTPGVGTLFSWIFFKGQIQILPFMNILKIFWRPKRCSVTGNRTRATWVRARYPNH